MPTKYTIGVDIGATKTVVGLVQAGKIIQSERFLTQPSQKTNKLTIISNLVRALTTVWSIKVDGIGIGIAGTTDSKKQLFLRGANFPKSFLNIDFKKELKKFNTPIVLDNDVHCFTLGEAKFGVGKKYKNVFGITLGTGLGGALVIDGKIYSGRNNTAGEIGHTIIDMSNQKAVCNIGPHGQLEAFVSGTGLARMIAERYEKPFSVKDLETHIKFGDKSALEIVNLAGYAFAVGCANVIQTLNPDVIVVGGGLTRSPSLWQAMKRNLKGLVSYPQLRSTPIIKTPLAHESIILGAVELIKNLKTR